MDRLSLRWLSFAGRVRDAGNATTLRHSSLSAPVPPAARWPAALSEDKGTRVLLLEAGGWDRDPWIKIPLGWPRLLLKRKHDWMYFAEPEATTGGRGLECARGRVIGGSSSINAMAYVRGHQGDYDRWAASGLRDWSYAHVLPYFRRQESWKGGASFYRGGDGPLATQMTRFSDPLVDAFAASGRAAGYKATPDYNGAQQEGFGVWQMTVKDGRRCSAADAYLRPALERPNLTVETDALATKIIFDGRRAVGVEYIKHGETVTAHADREVILSGGVINSPQLLMLSGIGDPEELAAHGIAVKVRAARRRQESAGPHLGRHQLCAQGARSVPPGDAVRPHRAGAGARLSARRRHRDRTADRTHGVPEKPPGCRCCPTCSLSSTRRR